MKESAAKLSLWPLVPLEGTANTIEIVTWISQVTNTLAVRVPPQTAQGAMRSRTLCRDPLKWTDDGIALYS